MQHKQTVKVMVSGKVQGVYFRACTRDKALKLGLVGSAINLDNGDVLVTASGEQTAIHQLINWLHEGSPASEVVSVQVERLSFQPFEQFTIG